MQVFKSTWLVSDSFILSTFIESERKHMNMTGVDLEKALQKTKKQAELKNPDETLQAFKSLLGEVDRKDQEILDQIFSGGSEVANQLDIKKLEADRIFTTAQIKDLCSHYRLRFLDAKYFKGEIPYEAIAKIKALQKDQSAELKGYKLIAPAPMFQLENKDKDPLLMLPLGNDRFYLVHKWGNDLHPLRKLMVYPFRSFKTLLFTVAGLAALIAWAFPDSVVMGPYDQHSFNIRVIFFFYLFLSFSGLTALYGFSRMKNFNSELWNSKYFD